MTEEQLREVAMESGVLDVDDDFLDADFRAKCEQIMPDKEMYNLMNAKMLICF